MCMCMIIYVNVYVNVYECAWECMWMCMRVHVNVNVYECAWECMWMCMRVHVNVNVYVNVYALNCVCTELCMDWIVYALNCVCTELCSLPAVCYICVFTWLQRTANCFHASKAWDGNSHRKAKWYAGLGCGFLDQALHFMLTNFFGETLSGRHPGSSISILQQFCLWSTLFLVCSSSY